MLDAQKRQQLDSIVRDMGSQNASPQEVQLVVDDFISKYGVAEKPAPFRPEKIGEDLLKGIGKGAASTLYGVDKVARSIPGIGGAINAINPQRAGGEKPEWLAPKGTAQNIGFGLEQIAEFLIPAAKVAKVSGAIQKGSLALKAPSIVQKGISLAGRSALEATAAGTQRYLQTGGDEDEAKTAALVAGAFPIIGAVVSGVGKAIGATGKKIQQAVIRPNARDFADGFKMENVTKYDVGGSLSETVTKTHATMNNLSSQLQQKLVGSNKAINLNEVLESTRNALNNSKAIDFGENVAIQRVLKNVEGEIVETAGENGLVDLVQANLVKRGAGTKGAWAFGRVEPDAGAVEKVYSAFYHELRIAIEKAAPDGVRAINKQISELIPISNAALRRLPIEQRNNILSLTDSIGLFSAVFDPRALAVLGASKLSKSGKFAEFLISVAQKFKTANPIAKRFIP